MQQHLLWEVIRKRALWVPEDHPLCIKHSGKREENVTGTSFAGATGMMTMAHYTLDDPKGVTTYENFVPMQQDQSMNA